MCRQKEVYLDYIGLFTNTKVLNPEPRVPADCAAWGGMREITNISIDMRCTSVGTELAFPILYITGISLDYK
jgi:hypothetical protein